MSAYDAFAAVYDDWASHMTEDVEFYVELARAAEGPIVELAVGNGRVAIPVAAATGARIVGIDSHAPADNRIDITLESGAGVSLWWTTRSEWEGLADVAGLAVEALYGWFDRRPFDEKSEEFVWVTRKPA